MLEDKQSFVSGQRPMPAVAQAKQTARRQELYVALHPDTAHGGNAPKAASTRWDDASCQVGDTHRDPRFTKETAKATGKNERAMQRDAERGERFISYHIEQASREAGLTIEMASLPR